MADTLKFGPQWLRALSDGNAVPSLPPTSGLGIKAQLPKYRYGREELLTLYPGNLAVPDTIKKCPAIYVEECQKPLAIVPLSEEEQRLQQSVNSQSALRVLGRGGTQSTRGRGMERGRGRGRGRSEFYVVRGPENGDTGGFSRPRVGGKDDWQEVPAHKRYDRSYSRPHEDGPPNTTRRVEFIRSLSNENWRDRDDEEDDWRKAGTRERWSTRGSWRTVHPDRGGKDVDVRLNGPHKPRTIELDRTRTYQRSRSESGDFEENVPEWSLPADDDLDAVGTFDSSGQFVSRHEEGKEGERTSPTDAERGKPDVSVRKQTMSPERNLVRKAPSQEKPPSHPTTTPQPGDERPTSQSSKLSTVEGRKEALAPQQGSESAHRVLEQAQRGVGAGDGVSVPPQLHPQPPLQSQAPPQPEPQPPQPMASQDIPQEPTSKPEALQMEALHQMVTQMTSEPGGAPTTGENLDNASKLWLYKDPQGDVQGPFTSEDMSNWFTAGFFSMTLEVKRACDERFQPLGDLIKSWRRVPFLPGPALPPLLNTPPTAPSVETSMAPPTLAQPLSGIPMDLSSLHQQMMLQQFQVLQHQQMFSLHAFRNMQMQALQQVQEQEASKSLSPQQQQQLAYQLMMQSQPLLFQQQAAAAAAAAAALQQQRLSPQPAVTQPSPSQEQPTEVPPSWPAAQPGMWPQPTSVWELEQQQQQIKGSTAATSNPLLEAQLEKMRKEQEEQELQQRKQEEEQQQQLQQEELLRKREELRRQEEEIRRQREEMLREKEELERQRQRELKEVEEARRREEEERKRLEAERIRQEEERQRKEEEERERIRKEEERRQAEELRRAEEERRAEQERRTQEEEERRRKLEEERRRKQEEEHRRLQEAAKRQLEEQAHRQQEEQLQRQQEEQLHRQQKEQLHTQHEEQLHRQQEEGKKRQQEMQKKQEAQRQQLELQQQEALRKLQSQQEQLANIQLPPSVHWAADGSFSGQQQQTKTLTEIFQEEEKQFQEREARKQAELRQQHMQAIQQQQMQQQNQKTWANPSLPSRQGPRSLLEIQEEQSKQISAEKQKQQQQPKTASTVVSSSWASPWANAVGSQGPPSTGFWDDSTPAPAPQPTKKAATNKDVGEFPALSNKKSPQKSNANKSKSSSTKTKKEEEVLRRMLQEVHPQDEFTQWCEAALQGVANSVDVPTFVAFLQAVESPFEVHDYLRAYLGESREVSNFGKQFLEKRSHFKNKQKKEKQLEEDSIWGPAPAITPREMRGPSQPEAEGAKGKGKKKKQKMSKVDPNFLGFSVHAAPDRVNVGAIEPVE